MRTKAHKKEIRLKILPNLLFYQLISKPLAFFGRFWPNFAHLKPVFYIKFIKIVKPQNCNKKVIELPHVLTERVCV